VPKKLDPYVKAARVADEFVDAVEQNDGSTRRVNVMLKRRDRLMFALLDTAAAQEASDGEAGTTATVAPAP
jgi:hypothetical protein